MKDDTLIFHDKRGVMTAHPHNKGRHSPGFRAMSPEECERFLADGTPPDTLDVRIEALTKTLVPEVVRITPRHYTATHDGITCKATTRDEAVWLLGRRLLELADAAALKEGD